MNSLTSSRDAGVLSSSSTASEMWVTSVVSANAKINIWMTGMANTTIRMRGSRNIWRNSLMSICRTRSIMEDVLLFGNSFSDQSLYSSFRRIFLCAAVTMMAA